MLETVISVVVVESCCVGAGRGMVARTGLKFITREVNATEVDIQRTNRKYTFKQQCNWGT